MVYDLEEIERRLGAPDRQTLADEALAYLGARVSVNGVPVAPPTAGAVCLLEVRGSPYVMGGPTRPDAAAVAYFICDAGRAAAGLVRHATLVHPEPEEFILDTARILCGARGLAGPALAAVDVVYRDAFAKAATPFNFFPRSRDGVTPPPLAFGAEWLASVQTLGGRVGLTLDEALWGVPFVQLGYLHVAAARYDGAKDVTRANTLDWGAAFAAGGMGARQ